VAGKAVSAQNGRVTRRGFQRVRESARELSVVRSLIGQMQASRVEAQQMISLVLEQKG